VTLLSGRCIKKSPKGNQVKIPEPKCGHLCGNTNKRDAVWWLHWEEFSFLFNEPSMLFFFLSFLQKKEKIPLFL
jgi:hypothetical protein